GHKFARSLERRTPTIVFGDAEGCALASRAMFREAKRDSTDDLFSRLDLGPTIERALARLPEPFQSTLVLVNVEDQPYEAAATILGISVRTVRSHLFRGRRLMQDMHLELAWEVG